MKTIIELSQDEIGSVNISGAGMVDSVEYCALEIIKGASLPIIGVFLSYGIIKMLSKSVVE